MGSCGYYRVVPHGTGGGPVCRRQPGCLAPSRPLFELRIRTDKILRRFRESGKLKMLVEFNEGHRQIGLSMGEVPDVGSPATTAVPGGGPATTVKTTLAALPGAQPATGI